MQHPYFTDTTLTIMDSVSVTLKGKDHISILKARISIFESFNMNLRQYLHYLKDHSHSLNQNIEEISESNEDYIQINESMARKRKNLEKAQP